VDELVAELQAREMSEMEHRVGFKELSLLQTQGFELCHAIVGHPWAKHQSEGMRFRLWCPLPWSTCSGNLLAILPVWW
jgi:hypothetical protein